MIERYIETNARLYPDKVAIVCGQQHCTYRRLQERISAKALELGINFRKGQIVCVRAESTIDYLVTYFACHRAGLVVAPLEKDMPEPAFQEISHALCPQAVPEGSADVLYTTGTTGRSKGVVVGHRAIVANAENLIEGQGFCHELAFVVCGPLNHIGSLSKVWPVMMLGATLIIVDGLKDMGAFYHAFRYPAPKMATFLVPASIRILIQFSSEKLAALADKIDFMETGAAAISHADMQALCRLLPHSRLYNTYASTETGIISTYNFNDGRCIPGCLGRSMRHSQVVITDDGLIACKGSTLMSGYVGGADGLGDSPYSRLGTVDMVRTSDLGRLDEEGMLHLEGRGDDIINVGGFKVSPTEVEDAALASEDVKDCICIGVPHRITGSALKLLVVVMEGHALDKKALALFLKSRLETYKVPMLYEQVDAIRRTFNGKLDRKFYMQTKPA